MEFTTDNREEYTNSSVEAEQESGYIRAGRFYECVHCKRGFDTAQALGGHMNIHRRDRARNKPTTPRKQEDYTGPARLPNSRNGCKLSENPDQQQRCGMSDFGGDRRKRTIHPGEWRVRLDSPPVIMGGLETNHEEELDLELRLGYDS